jgi:hypothetical protein
VRWSVHPDDADDLELDDDNIVHLAGHSISPRDVLQVWSNEPVYVPNKKGLSATYLMLGDTYGGRALTIAVLPNATTRLLRPITGWNSTNGELTRWRPGRR